MFCVMPVCICRAAPVPSVEAKAASNVYACPVYKTEDRGWTYVCEA